MVDKIVFALLAFDDAAFSFCIKNFQMFRIILTSLGECSSSSSIFEISILENPDRKRINQSARICLSLALPYHTICYNATD